MGQFVDMMRAKIEANRRNIGLGIERATTEVCERPEDLVAWVLEPLHEHEARYPVRFKDMPLIGWPLSLASFLSNSLARMLLVPFVGLGPRWPTLNIPGRRA